MLYLDAGNSLIKVAEFAEGEWSMKLRVPNSQLNEAESWLLGMVSSGWSFIGCSVVKDSTDHLDRLLTSKIKWITVEQVPTELIDYSTPETLGMDRFLACFGAWSHAQGHSVIVVDAGTATTIDFMDSTGVFRGGVIAPGIGALEHGLRTHAPALPEVARIRPAIWPAKSTREAVQWGLTGSYQSLVRDHVQRFLVDDPQAKLWISGGDAELLMNLGGLYTYYHPNLVFEGLRTFAETINLRSTSH
jgi:type III pantothenate kinase